jgi:hypothetical protein
MCVLIYSTTFVWNISLSKTNIIIYVQIASRKIGLILILSDFF